MHMTIPVISRNCFFQLAHQSPQQHVVCNVVTLLSLQDVKKYPEVVQLAKDMIIAHRVIGRYRPKDLQALLMALFSGTTQWAPKDPAKHAFGYQLRTERTLIEYEGEEVEVVELYGYSEHTRKRNNVVEYFAIDDPKQLLWALETRVATPESMYTGLDTHGNNL